MLSSIARIGRLARVLLPLIVAVGTMAQFCEAGETITYRNDTSEVLHVEVNRRGSSTTLEPGKKVGVGYIMETTEPFNIVIRDEAGCVVWKRDTTLDELRGGDLTVTITPDLLPPKDERTDCDDGS